MTPEAILAELVKPLIPSLQKQALDKIANQSQKSDNPLIKLVTPIAIDLLYEVNPREISRRAAMLTASLGQKGDKIDPNDFRMLSAAQATAIAAALQTAEKEQIKEAQAAVDELALFLRRFGRVLTQVVVAAL